MRQRSPDTWIFWVFASNAARVEAAYKDIAAAVRLPGRNENAAKVTMEVARWLADEGRSRWVMIVDNLDDVETLHATVGSPDADQSVASLVPQSDNGAVLITSRSVDAVREMIDREDDVLHVGQMSEHEAEALLLKKLRKPPDADQAGLLAKLEHFPLAITQAAAFINRQPGMTVSKYLSRLHASTSGVSLLAKSLPDARRHEKATSSIFMTWQITFEQIRIERAGAADLLSFMSFFNRQGIPKAFLKHFKPSCNGGDADARRLSVGGKEEEEVEEHIAVLNSYSLIARKETEDEFEMHALVQMATQVWLESMAEEGVWWDRFVLAMAMITPDTAEFDDWPICRMIEPHVDFVTKRQPLGERQEEAWVRVVTNAGWFALRQGMLPRAHELARMSLDKTEHMYGMTDSRTLLNVRLLGSVLEDQGKYEEAEKLRWRALTGHRLILGEDDPATRRSLNDVALVLLHRGKYDEAERLFQQTLAVSRTKLGEDHIDTKIGLSNVASVLHHQGKHAKAETLDRLALAHSKQLLGEDHESTLKSANNLATVLEKQGKYEEAESLARWALAKHEQKFGEKDLGTMTKVHNLASGLDEQGKYEEAEHLFRRAFEGRKAKLGEEHIYTLASASGLASVVRELGKYEEAESLRWQTLAAYERQLGNEHAYTLTSVWCLASLLSHLGRYEDAAVLYERACDGHRSQFGESHWSTIACCDQLADMLARANGEDGSVGVDLGAKDDPRVTLLPDLRA